MSKSNLLFVFTLFGGAFAQTHPDNTVVIEGKRSELKRSQNVVNETRINPKNASRFDIGTYFKKMAGTQTQNSGAIKNSGFFLPRIRGQDARSSEVYLNGIPLSSPYTGLPIFDDIDLRAFDEGLYYQGFSDITIDSVNAAGALNLVFHDVVQSGTRVGSEFGQPHGGSGWLAVRDHKKDDDSNIVQNIEARVYVREHETNGKYRFYSDEGTPFDTADDQIRERTDNDRSSRQTILNLKLNSNEHTSFGVFSIFNQFAQGLPAMGGQTRTYASTRGEQELHQLFVEREISSYSGLQTKIKLFSNYNYFHSQTSDPENRIVAMRSLSTLRGNGKTHGALAFIKSPDARISLQMLNAVGGAQLNDAVSSERRAQSLYMGGEFNLFSEATIGLIKLKTERFKDRSRVGVDAHAVKNRDYQSIGAGLKQRIWQQLQISFQTGYIPRPPSLFESFGDGGAVQSNESLQPEVTRHKEVSLGWSWSQNSCGLTYFKDQTDQKIVLLPAGNPNSWQANNLYRTDISGWDLWVIARPIKPVDFSLSIFHMKPQTIYDGQARQIPGLAQNHLAADVGTQSWFLNPRWHSHYRGPYFRDLSNSVRYGDVWIHDASLDYSSGGSLDLRLGGGIYNIFDQKSMTVATTDGNLTGRTAVSELNGYPLPGRHYKLFVNVLAF